MARQEVTLYVTSRCNLSCDGCIMGNFMRENRHYEMSLLEVAEFLRVTRESGYVVDIILSGGEPLLWRHLKQGLKMIRKSGIVKRILLFTNAMDISQVDDGVMSCLSQLRISRYCSNADNTRILCQRYPKNAKIADRREFYRQPAEPIDDVLPCQCVNTEYLYMNGKVYACAHGASANNGRDELPDGTKLYVPLRVGYMDAMAAIRAAQERSLCAKCSSNVKVQAFAERFKKKERVKPS